MQFTTKLMVLAQASFLLIGVCAQEDTRAKGIFLDSSEDRKTAVKFNVLLDRDGTKKQVPSNYRFVDGDRMKFQFELNRDAHVYVLHRTIAGSPDSLKKYAGPMGIEIIRDEDKKQPEKARYQLLFPTSKTGTDNKLRAGRVQTVPSGDTFFSMDDQPGIEKLFIIVSETPIKDLDSRYDISGEVRGAGSSGGSKLRTSNDSDEDVTRQLSQYASNTEMSLAKGMNVVDGYGIVVDRSKPMVVQVDLNHHRR